MEVAGDCIKRVHFSQINIGLKKNRIKKQLGVASNKNITIKKFCFSYRDENPRPGGH